jgi:hypothetical protein
MQLDWVKAIGKKLREDLGDCPTLPQELVDAIDRLEQARQASSQASLSKAGETMKRGQQDWVVEKASASHRPL